jgi:hypothetical protein
MDDGVRARVEAILGRALCGWAPVQGGGYTPAERWRVHFDGGSAFVKVATDPRIVAAVRAEGRWTQAIPEALRPAVLGFDDDPVQPVLVLEDLSHARWPPPWEAGDVARVLDLLREVASVRPVPDLPRVADRLSASGWRAVAEDPAPLLALGLVTLPWIDAALPALLDAERDAPVDGDDLVHFDVRSDNLCLLPDRAVLVDWSAPARGNADVDVAFWAPSLRLEGGPIPEALLPNAGPLAAVVAGFFAARAGLPELPEAPRVRSIQQRQLRIALPWAARALGLAEPDGPWAGAALADLDKAFRWGAPPKAFAGGRIRRAAWFAQTEEALIDAYLATDDPIRTSGKTGDEADWRWSRELILDAVHVDPCALLDVGCASGHLMASLRAWGAERGRTIEPYGLEISDRMARVARRRLPHWADRITVGNVAVHLPARAFDLVHLALDCVPPPDRAGLVAHVRRRFLAPGGRIVLRPDRVVAGEPDGVAVLRELGIEPGGVLEAVHPTTGAVRRTAWIGG